MTTYQQAGVDIQKGDQASKIAYELAQKTFSSRKNLTGQPVINTGGYAGLLNLGNFYLVQCDDGVGTKIAIAQKIQKYDTLGYDLLAMVCDDAICIGAETISITNTLDTNKVNPAQIQTLMQGLAQACINQKIIISGGEIAELGNLVNGNVWNATAVGIITQEKLITGENIQNNDDVIALSESGFRSNGFSLVRYVLEKKYGPDVYQKKYQNTPWGEILLTPSTIYSNAILEIIGRFSEKKQHKIKGISHITGGGIPGNINRILKKTGLGVNLDNLFQPPEFLKHIQEIGKISNQEAYKTWNMGNGMLLVTSPVDTKNIINSLHKSGIKAQIAGKIIADKKIIIQNKENLIFTY